MKILSSIAFMLLSIAGYAQNMVPNPSFEIYSSCSTGQSQTNMAPPWQQYTSGTTDYYNACAPSSGQGVPKHLNAGYQPAASGKAYMGAFSFQDVNATENYSEYLYAPITPLTINTKYEVSVYVSLSNWCQYGNNGLGVWFFDNGLTSMPTRRGAMYYVTPQIRYESYGVILDTVNWVRLTSQFVADSAYDNIVIGMFIPDLVNGGLKVKDKGGAHYGDSYYYIDSVVVQAIKSENVKQNEQIINKPTVFPNPVQNELTIDNIHPGTVIKLFDLLGRMIMEQTATITTSTINTHSLVTGSYVLQLKDGNSATTIKIVKE